MNIIQRLNAPTPKFFKALRTIGLILTAISGTLLAAPVALPAIITTVAGYLTVGGAVMTAVAQTAVPEAGNPNNGVGTSDANGSKKWPWRNNSGYSVRNAFRTFWEYPVSRCGEYLRTCDDWRGGELCDLIAFEVDLQKI